MSYGIWRKRGLGWSSIEIDTPGNGTQLYELKYENELSHKLLISGLKKHGVVFDDYCDYYQLRWELNQTKNQPQRTIVEYCPGGGEHVRWIAYDDAAGLDRALDTVEASDYDREQCGVLARSGYVSKRLYVEGKNGYYVPKQTCEEQGT